MSAAVCETQHEGIWSVWQHTVLYPRTSGLHLTKATHINRRFNSIEPIQGHLALSGTIGKVMSSLQKGLHVSPLQQDFLSWGGSEKLRHGNLTYDRAWAQTDRLFSWLHVFWAVNTCREREWIWFDVLCCEMRDYLWLVIHLRRGRGLVWL